MLRFIARFFGFWIFAAALVAAVVDGAKSIAASALVLTPLSETWQTIALFLGKEEPAQDLPAMLPWPLDTVAAVLLAAPTVVVLAAVGIAFLVLGAKRRRLSLGREYAH